MQVNTYDVFPDKWENYEIPIPISRLWVPICSFKIQYGTFR